MSPSHLLRGRRHINKCPWRLKTRWLLVPSAWRGRFIGVKWALQAKPGSPQVFNSHGQSPTDSSRPAMKRHRKEAANIKVNYLLRVIQSRVCFPSVEFAFDRHDDRQIMSVVSLKGQNLASVPGQETGWENVPEMFYFVSSATFNLNSVNQSHSARSSLFYVLIETSQFKGRRVAHLASLGRDRPSVDKPLKSVTHG